MVLKPKSNQYPKTGDIGGKIHMFIGEQASSCHLVDITLRTVQQ